MTESTRRLIATRAELTRVKRELQQWRARAASYELAVAIEGESVELRARRDHALAQANGLARWLDHLRIAEQRIARRVRPPAAEIVS